MIKLKDILNELTSGTLLEISNSEIISFLVDKDFVNSKSKVFLYHGTSKHPNDFNLRDDYDNEDGNLWSDDLPAGYLFLTTNIKEASAYGKYIIPCELHRYDNITFKIDGYNPSRAFDMDYGTDLYKPDVQVGFWEKYGNSGKTNLIIKGDRNKQTIITDYGNVIPRVDLAVKMLGVKNK